MTKTRKRRRTRPREGERSVGGREGGGTHIWLMRTSSYQISILVSVHTGLIYSWLHQSILRIKRCCQTFKYVKQCSLLKITEDPKTVN